ncbi:MAG: hypothetical protein ABJ314_06780, partial [Ilumatobacter sp.]|uniref:hypothetical protein n=1 Tax=Ilumatobacter sp. TaxID=1967498 RepID=UPI003297FEB1
MPVCRSGPAFHGRRNALAVEFAGLGGLVVLRGDEPGEIAALAFELIDVEPGSPFDEVGGVAGELG